MISAEHRVTYAVIALGTVVYGLSALLFIKLDRYRQGRGCRDC